MSWEPLTPVGFSPCGTAFGSVRAPYSARCNFFSDGSTADNRIQWYVVPDGTPRYQGFTAFYPRVDWDADEANTVHEEEGAGRHVRKFKPRPVFVAPPPHDVHGDPEDFLGNSPKAKYFPDGVPPVAPCAVVRVEVEGIAVGAEPVAFVPGRPAAIYIGAALIPPPPPPPCHAGIAIGAVTATPIPVHAAGVELGGLITATIGSVTAGLALGGHVVTPLPPSLAAGILVGADAVIAPPPAAGIAIGATLSDPSIAMLNAGVSLDADALPPPLPTAGIAIGATLAELLDTEAGIRLNATIDGITLSVAAGLAVNAVDVGVDADSYSAGITTNATIDEETLTAEAGLAVNAVDVGAAIETLSAGFALGALAVAP